jgi:hypothetical protein
LLSGNYNILPRSSLTLLSMVRNSERQSNKFNKIATTDFGEFFYNAVAYDFSFDMNIMCRGMNEASSIIEQITSRFSPNYTLLINEIPNQVTPTSTPVQLLDVSLETEEYEDISANIININVGLMLKGNFYAPIEQMDKIHNVDMYMNLWNNSEKNDYTRARYFQYDVTDSVVQHPNAHTLFETPFIKPVVTDIVSNDSIEVGNELMLRCVVSDFDNKIDELSFIWSVAGSATIENVITGPKENAILIGTATEIVTVQVIVTDVHNNTSNIFSKQITIV